MALHHWCGALVNWLLLKHGPERRKGLLCGQEVRRRWSRGNGRGEERDLGVPWEWTSRLLCFLIPLNAELQGGIEKRRSMKGGGGWWGGRNHVFTLKGSRRVGWGSVSVYIGVHRWFYVCSEPEGPEVVWQNNARNRIEGILPVYYNLGVIGYSYR